MPSVGDVRHYWDEIDTWRGEIRGARLARTLALFYEDPRFRQRYEECPGSTSGHHAQLGGLLKHTCEVARIALAVCELHPTVDRELLVAGALLHDVGKLESYRWEGCFEATVPGVALGHVVLGALLLERRVRTESPMPCTEAELMILEHLILSHHGAPEFGAPVPPLTLEAEILHHADNASAKTESMHGALQNPDNFLGDGELSTRGIWQLDKRRAWRSVSDWGRPAPSG
jgi:3'-5' exoribonuclease